MVTKMMALKKTTRPPAAVKDAAVIGSKVGAAMDGARRARQAKTIKPWGVKRESETRGKILGRCFNLELN